MAYTCTLYNSILEVDQALWNQFRRGDADPFMDPHFIRAVEVSMADSGRFWHAVFHDPDGRPMGCACICLYRVDASLLADGFAKTVANAFKRVVPWLLHFNVLFCGLPISAGQSSLRLAPDCDANALAQALDAQLNQLARANRAKCIVLKEYTAEECARLPALADLGYLRADSLPMNHAQPGYRDFEHFCSSQKSRKRHPIRTSQKKFDKSGLRVVQLTGRGGADAIYTDEVHRLYENVLDRAKVKLEKIPAEFFRELARQLPDESAFTFIYQGERVVAFAASLFTKAVYHQMFVGVDYSLNSDYDLYFNLFFHAVDYGFRQNVADIYVGQSADTFKQRKLGCYPVPLYFYVKGCDALTTLVIRKGFHLLFPPRMAIGDASDAT